MRFFIVLGLFFLSITSCSTDTLAEEKALDLKKVTDLKSEITALVDSSVCNDETECAYVGFGSKACGGYLSYLVYSNSIDTDLLLTKVTEFNQMQHEFNEKYNIVSDCSILLPPTGLTCEDNKCKAVN